MKNEMTAENIIEIIEKHFIKTIEVQLDYVRSDIRALSNRLTKLEGEVRSPCAVGNAIKSCPFCGVIPHAGRPGSLAVIHQTSACPLSGRFFGTEVWNRRDFEVGGI